MYGVYNYTLLQNGGTLFDIFINTLSLIKEYYFSWTGLYSALFVWTLNPTVFGLDFITPYIMIGSIIISTYYLLKVVFIDVLKIKFSYFIIVLTTTLFCTIQFIPSASEGFYWFSGSAGYTLFYSLSLILYAFMFKMILSKKQTSFSFF